MQHHFRTGSVLLIAIPPGVNGSCSSEILLNHDENPRRHQPPEAACACATRLTGRCLRRQKVSAGGRFKPLEDTIQGS